MTPLTISFLKWSPRIMSLKVSRVLPRSLWRAITDCRLLSGQGSKMRAYTMISARSRSTGGGTASDNEAGRYTRMPFSRLAMRSNPRQ